MSTSAFFVPGMAIAGEDVRERAWRDFISARVPGDVPSRRQPAGLVLKFVLDATRVRIDLDNLVRPPLDALRDAAVFSRGFSNLDALLATKEAGSATGVHVEVVSSQGVAGVSLPGAVALTIECDLLPREGGAEAKRQWRDMVERAWLERPLDNAVGVFVDFSTPSPLSLKDTLKPVIDGLEPVLGRDPQGRLEFCPQDDRVTWLRAQRDPQQQTALRVRVGVVETPWLAEVAPDWFWEGSVQQRVAEHLARDGWRIVSAADTASRETGTDLILERGDERLNVEVKGWPSTVYARGERAGQPKPTNPSVQARHWFAGALLSAVLMRDAKPSERMAMAFPDKARYRQLLARSATSLNALGIEVLLVGEAGAVIAVDPRELPVEPSRPASGSSGHLGVAPRSGT